MRSRFQFIWPIDRWRLSGPIEQFILFAWSAIFAADFHRFPDWNRMRHRQIRLNGFRGVCSAVCSYFMLCKMVTNNIRFEYFRQMPNETSWGSLGMFGFIINSVNDSDRTKAHNVNMTNDWNFSIICYLFRQNTANHHVTIIHINLCLIKAIFLFSNELNLSPTFNTQIFRKIIA